MYIYICMCIYIYIYIYNTYIHHIRQVLISWECSTLCFFLEPIFFFRIYIYIYIQVVGIHLVFFIFKELIKVKKKYLVLFALSACVIFKNIFLMHPSTTHKYIKSSHKLLWTNKYYELICSIPFTIRFHIVLCLWHYK